MGDNDKVSGYSDRNIKIRKLTSIAKSWGINGNLTVSEIGLQLVDRSVTHPVRKNVSSRPFLLSHFITFHGYFDFFSVVFFFSVNFIKLLEAFHLLYQLKTPDEIYPLVIIEKIITCLTLSLTHEYKLEALKLLLLIAEEERGLRNILRLQGCDATMCLLFDSEEILKPHCLNLLIRISESIRGSIAILEYANSPQKLLLQLQNSKKLGNLILKVYFWKDNKTL
uniref:Uncharacterized protein n=1 Tax=Trichobilharzia regenti TaxID=157069 RepID=A0AA85ILD7_TRIRE|nr:unnamed protein product [Trichobilharzia regenti]